MRKNPDYCDICRKLYWLYSTDGAYRCCCYHEQVVGKNHANRYTLNGKVIDEDIVHQMLWADFITHEVPEGCVYYMEHCMHEWNKE